MPDNLEKLIQTVYKKWKADQPKIQEAHPDEEIFACFLENRLNPEENEKMTEHLIKCDRCTSILATQIRLKTADEKEIPEKLLARLKEIISQQIGPYLLEIILKVKEKTIEILNSTGDVLVGQELVPAPVLRSRAIKDFKDEVTILKDFKNLRVEIKIENKAGKAFNLTVVAKNKETQSMLKDLRVTLIKDELELESYLADSGKVVFEHVLLGKYTVEISDIQNKLASVLLDKKT